MVQLQKPQEVCRVWGMERGGHLGLIYSFPHNHGSGKWLYLRGNDPIGGTPLLTSMIMGGRVY